MSSSDRVLVTGSQGFVGSHVREVLSRRGHAVAGIDLPDTGAEIPIDLGDRGFDAMALARRVGPVSGIIHLAARISRDSSVDARARRNAVAIAEAGVRLAEAWAQTWGPTHVVFCSSIKVYGALEHPIDPLVGPGRPEPNTYGSAKALAERLFRISAE